VYSAEAHCPRDWLSASRPHPSTFIAGNDAILIDERAATRGRGATEGGDEHDGVKRRDPFEIQLANNRGERRDPGRARSSVSPSPTSPPRRAARRA